MKEGPSSALDRLGKSQWGKIGFSRFSLSLSLSRDRIEASFLSEAVAALCCSLERVPLWLGKSFVAKKEEINQDKYV